MLLGRTHLSLPPDEQEKYAKYVATRLKANNNNKVKEEDGEEVSEGWMGGNERVEEVWIRGHGGMWIKSRIRIMWRDRERKEKRFEM